MSDDWGMEAGDPSLFDVSPQPLLRRIAYLLATFPLGIFYFAFLSAGLSLGLGLAIIWIGLPILALVMAAWLALADFERRLAASLLGLEIARPMSTPQPESGLWQTAKFRLGDSHTWKSLLFLLLKLPLGIAGFSLVVSAATSSLALLAVPFVYEVVPVQIAFGYITTWDEALLCALGGVLMAGATIFLINGLAWLWRQAASVLLSRADTRSLAGAEPQEAPLTIR